MNDILSIGSSGLSTYRKTLETISSNIVNANTEGYVRRQTVLKGTGDTNMLVTAKPNSNGSGVDVETVGRATDIFLQKQMLTATAVNSQAQILSDSLSQLERTAFSASNNLSESLGTFYNNMQDVANAPTTLANRYALINSAQEISDRFNATSNAIKNGITSVDSAIKASLDSINSLTTQIANLNVSITKNAASGQKPNDLLDQRDSILQKLASIIGFSTSENPNGSINVYIGDTAAGLALVDTKGAHILGSQSDGPQINIVYDPYSSSIPVNSINHGTVAGLMDYRQSATSLLNTVDRLAVSLTSMLNKQHTEGIDLNGKDGLPLFATDGVSINPSQTNRGSARIDLTFDANTTSSGNTYSARYDEKTDLWTVHSKSGVSASGKNNIVLDGIHFNINGKPADGDTFFGQPMANAAASMRFLIKDPSQIASALPLYVEKNTANKGSSTLTISDRHASIPASSLPQAKSLIAPNLSGINSFLRDGAAFVIPAGTSKANLISLGTVSSVHFLTIGNEISNLNRPAPIAGQSTFTLSFKLDDQSSQTQLTINPKGSSLTDIANAINDAAEKTTNPKLSNCIHASVSNGVLDITGLNNANPSLPAHTISDAVFDTIPHIPHIPDSIGFPVTGENEASHTPAQLQVFTKEGIQVSGPRLTTEQVSRLINEKNGFSKDAVYSYLGVNNNYPGLIASSSEAPLTINSINSYTKNITFQNNPSFESSKSDASGAMSSGSVYVLNLEDAPSIRLSGDEITGKNSDDIAGLLSQKLNSLVTQRSIYGGAMDFSSMSSPTFKFNVTLNGTTSQVTFHRSIDPAGNLMSTGNFEIDGDASIHVGLVPDLSGTTASVVTFPPTAALAAGQSVTVAGLTFTVSAGSTATQAQLATAFANLANGATTGASVGVGNGLGTYSGTFTGFSTGDSNGTGVTATASTFSSVVAAPAVSTTVGANLPFVTSANIHLVVSAYDELGSQDKEFSISAAGSPNSGDLSALGLSGNNAPGFSGNNAIMQLKGSGFLDPKDLSSTKVLKIQFGAASPYTNATITVNPNNKDPDGLPILESSLPAKLTASWSRDGHIVIKSTDQTAHLTTSNTSERSDAAALGFFCTDLSFQNNLEGQSGITISSSLGALNIENLSTSPDGSRFNLNKALDEDLIVMTTSDPSMNSLRSIATDLTPDPLQTQFEPQDLSVKIISGTKLEIYSTTKDASGNPIRLATRNWKSLEPVTFGKLSFIIQGNPVVDDVLIL